MDDVLLLLLLLYYYLLYLLVEDDAFLHVFTLTTLVLLFSLTVGDGSPSVPIESDLEGQK